MGGVGGCIPNSNLIDMFIILLLHYDYTLADLLYICMLYMKVLNE
jgi:hypothetical protein